jgi:hypothetical protein
MARVALKPTKTQMNIISKYRVGGLTMQKAMDKLGITGHNKFYRIFHTCTMALN